jgi:hypothetical protein
MERKKEVEKRKRKRKRIRIREREGRGDKTTREKQQIYKPRDMNGRDALDEMPRT